MNVTSITRVFPDSAINMIDGDGNDVTPLVRSVTVILHTREGESVPCTAEVFGGEGWVDDDYAEIGLWFEGKALSDFDGAFSLPKEVATMLREGGFTVSEDFTA